jgi:Tat protein translocase TatB subunit
MIERRNMFGTLGGPELFLIFVVALIVFGPRKLPEIGKSLGKMMAEFRRASNEFRSTIESEVEAEKIREAMRIEPPKVEPLAPSRAAGASSTPGGMGEPAGSVYPGAPEASPLAETPAAPPALEAAPAPETVSRQPTSTPIEPK